MRPAAPERLDTPRLTCERLRPSDAAELEVLLGDPRVARTLSASGEPLSRAECHENLLAKLDHWERLRFGMWMLRDQATGAMVGRGGLQSTFVGGRDQIEVGWAIMPERWGQGLATELAAAAVKVAFRDLRLPEIVALSLPGNRASVRVMEKTGFTFSEELVHAELPHLLYRRLPRRSELSGRDDPT